MGGHQSSLEGTPAPDVLPEIDVGSDFQRTAAASSHASLPVTPPAPAFAGSTVDTFPSGSGQRRRELRNSTTSLPGSTAPSADAAKRFSHFFPLPSTSKSRFRLPHLGGSSSSNKLGVSPSTQQATPPRGIVVVNPGPRTVAASSLPRLDAITAAAAAAGLTETPEGRIFSAFSCGALDGGVNWEARELTRIPRFTPILPIKSTNWMMGGGKTTVRSPSPSQSLTDPADFQPLAEMVNRYEEYFQNSAAPILQKQEELTCLQRKVEYESRKVLQLMYDRQNGKAFMSPTKASADLPHCKSTSSERPRAAGSRQLDSISADLADLHHLVTASTELLRRLTLDVRALQQRVSTLSDAPYAEENTSVVNSANSPE
nr:unnamed protein product [Spirometra erinaceieuropaei]